MLPFVVDQASRRSLAAPIWPLRESAPTAAGGGDGQLAADRAVRGARGHVVAEARRDSRRRSAPKEVARPMRVQGEAPASTSTAPFWLRTSTTGPRRRRGRPPPNEVRTVGAPLTAAARTAPFEFSTSRAPADALGLDQAEAGLQERGADVETVTSPLPPTARTPLGAPRTSIRPNVVRTSAEPVTSRSVTAALEFTTTASPLTCEISTAAKLVRTSAGAAHLRSRPRGRCC